MNIREHIEAGHYPKDVLGRPQVPGDDGATWSVICTDKPYGNPVVAFRNSDGCIASFGNEQSKFTIRLLPPPPRKVKVRGWLFLTAEDAAFNSTTYEDEAKHIQAQLRSGEKMVEVTGEYEEPWPAASKATTEA